MNMVVFGYGLVLGLVLSGAVGWLGMDWLARERDRYRRLFLQASGEIGRARRKRK